MSELFNYKCPNCGGALEFNAKAQTIKCPYCDCELDVEAMSAHDEELAENVQKELKWEDEAGQDWQEGETDGMRVYVCDSCGGEIIADTETAAMKCPYCDNPVVMKGNLAGTLKPDFVIPFKKDKNDAKNAYMEHLKGKKFLPKVFRDQNHIDEMKALYVPFWLYDAEVDARANYHATRTRLWADAINNYVETSHYAVVREGTIVFDNVPVDGSVTMADELMQSIEPFDFSEAVDFKTAYLAGYLADKYTLDAEGARPIAQERIKNSADDMINSTVAGYESIQLENSSARLKYGREKYAMYPVWILNTTYQGEHFIFAMNGQTGKFVGNLPLDKGAFWRNFGIVGGIAAVIAFAVQMLLM